MLVFASEVDFDIPIGVRYLFIVPVEGGNWDTVLSFWRSKSYKFSDKTGRHPAGKEFQCESIWFKLMTLNEL